MKIQPLIQPSLFLSLYLILEFDETDGSGMLKGSVNPCEISKLVVRVTRVIYTLYGDNTEPPVTQVKCNYYDPKSKKGKQLGVTAWNTNGRSLYPVWDEADGTLESDDNPGIRSDLALEFIIFSESKVRLFGPLWRVVTIQKQPILGIHGFEVKAQFISVMSQSYGNFPFLPNGNQETCTINRMWPFPLGNCVYGYVYFMVKYDKVDPTCDDTSTLTVKATHIKKSQP